MKKRKSHSHHHQTTARTTSDPLDIHACPYCRPEKLEGLDAPENQESLHGAFCSSIHLNVTGEHRDGLDAEYCKKHGILTLTCYSCGGLVSTFAIAEKLTLVPSKTGPYLLEPKGSWTEAEEQKVQ